jgi:hypothetical protein
LCYSSVCGRVELDCIAILSARQAATEVPWSDAPAVRQLVQSAHKSVEAAQSWRIDGHAYGVTHFGAPVAAGVMLLCAPMSAEAASRQKLP